MKRYLLYLFLLSSISSFSQKLSVSGNIQDTSAKGPLPNAIVMAIKLMDSEYNKPMAEWTNADVAEARELFKHLLAERKAMADGGEV